VSRAARETTAPPSRRPRRGDELPPLRPGDLAVREARPRPEPGPVRDALAEQAAARADRVAAAMEAAAGGFVDRVTAVVTARLRGPKARRGTRFWSDRVKSAEIRGGNASAAPTSPSEGCERAQLPPAIEHKALDPDYVVPDTLAAEITEALRPVALRVVLDASRDAVDRLTDAVPDADPGISDDAEVFAVDSDLLAGAIDEALGELLGSARRFTGELRDAILTGESDGLDLDELLDRVGEAATRGGNWLRLGARTLGTALAAQSALATARALGVTHAQWISRRDDRVRLSHRAADGQVRALGDHFTVGRHRLEYPGDPSGLPGTAQEVHHCRCGLLLLQPDPGYLTALGALARSAQMGVDDPALDELFDAVRDTDLFVPVPDGPDGPGVLDLPGLASAVEIPAPVVGYRQLSGQLDAVPGQQLVLPAGTVLGLAAPAAAATAATLRVLIPAGLDAAVAGGALVLTDAATVDVLAVDATGVAGRLVL
jgi:hypothetical protein